MQIWIAAEPTPEPAPSTSTVCPAFKLRAAHQHVPRGQEDQRHAGGLLEVEHVGNGDDVDARNRDQLAVAAVHAVAQHVELRAEIVPPGVALLAMIAENHRRQQHARALVEVGNVFAVLDDLSGNIAAKNMRQLHARQALAHKQVKMVQRAGAHADQHMVFAQNGIGNVFVLQDFGTAKLMNADGFHRAIPREFELRTPGLGTY